MVQHAHVNNTDIKTGYRTGENHRKQRLEVRCPAWISRDVGETHPIMIEDTSEHGFGISGELGDLEVGQMTTIHVEGVGSFCAIVIWRQESRSGLRLLEERETLSEAECGGLADFLAAVA